MVCRSVAIKGSLYFISTSERRPVLKGITVLILVIALVGLATSVTLGAVDSVDILIKVLVEKNIITRDDAATVRAEIANIRQEEDAKKKSFNVSGKRPVKLSGYVQERYVDSVAANSNGNLEARRVRLSLAGDATEKVDFKVQVDFAGSRKGLTDAALVPNDDPEQIKLNNKSANFGKPTLLDAVIGYRLGDERKLSVGQFKIPFGLENLTSSTNLDTINRSLVTESLVPGRDTGNQGRDLGVQYSNIVQFDEDGAKSIEYYLGVFNGSGINVGDDSTRKDPAARIVWKPGTHGLALGASYFIGSVGAVKVDHNRLGGELVYAVGPWGLKGEYIRAKDAATGKHGWYTTLVRQISSDTQFVTRYDLLDPDNNANDDNTGTWTFGFNKFLNKDGYTRWQVNYERRREEGTQVPNNQFLAQFQAGF